MTRQVFLLALLLGGEDPSGGAVLELTDEARRALPRLEASGIVVHEDRLFVVDDTVNELFVFDRTGVLLHRLASAAFPRRRAKFEDLSFDPSTRTFFAVGSHYGWDESLLEERSVLLRFRLAGDGSHAIDDASVELLPLYRSFARRGMWKPRAMNIEGLAYDGAEEQIYVGLRDPCDRARIYRLPAGRLTGPEAEPPVPEEILSFEAGEVEGTPFCVSALAWLPDPQGLLIATSTENPSDHRFLGNRLWFARPGDEVRLLLDTFDAGMKAEGLAVEEDTIFISYDNDQDDTGIPSRIRAVPRRTLFPEVR